MNSRTFVKLVMVLALVVASVIPVACGGNGEDKEPTALSSPQPTATPAPPRPTPVPLPTYTIAETDASCANVITQAEIDATAATNKLTLPLPPCTEMDKPFRAQYYLDGEILYFYVPKGTPIVSPLTGKLLRISSGDVESPSDEASSVHILGEEYGAYLLVRNADFDSSLFGTTVQRGQVIGTVGDPLMGEDPEMTGVSLGLEATTVEPPSRVVKLSEPQYWAGNEPNFFAP